MRAHSLAGPPATLCVAMRAGRMTMYYTYILLSLKDHKLYIGWTEDLQKRVDRHSLGKVVATANRLPIKLMYYEACLVKKDAIKREKALKTGFGRAYIKRRLSNLGP